MRLRRSTSLRSGRVSFDELRALSLAGLTAALAANPVRAARLLEAAARYGMVEAQVAWGQVLLDGRGIVADPGRAVSWFGISARAGYPPGMNMLGRCLEKGWGTAIDLPEAAIWYRRAAEAWLDWGQYNLANMLLRGRGIPRDRPAALGWFYRAAQQGHAKSMNMVGRFLEEGWDVPLAPAAALTWYRRSAEGGDCRGQYNLATCIAARRDGLEEAGLWFLKAAESGTPDLLRTMVEELPHRYTSTFQDAVALAQARLISFQTWLSGRS